MPMPSPKAAKDTVIERRRHSLKGSITCRPCRTGIDC